MINRKNPPSQTIYVSTERWTVGIDIARGTIIKAAPIVKWTIGKEASWFKKYLEQKNLLLKWIPLSN